MLKTASLITISFLAMTNHPALAVNAMAKDTPAESESVPAIDRSQLSIERLYDGKEFKVETTPTHWMHSTGATTDHPDALQWKKSLDDETIEVHQQLQPDGEETVVLQLKDPAALSIDKLSAIEELRFSNDQRFLLAKVNAQKVWRRKTLAEYRILNRDTNQWRSLGDGQPLMHATFSPAADRVVYIRDRGLYSENTATGEKTPIAVSDNPHLIHGTFDWVYEEELGLRKGFQFNSDGSKVAFWQLDDSEVPIQTLIDNTSERYPQLKQFAYPKVGQTNSAAKLGVYDFASGQTTWIQIQGDPRNHYLAAMQWVNFPAGTGDASQSRLLIQQLNRPQNENRFWVADVETGAATVLHTETSDGWVDHQATLPEIPSATGDSVDVVLASERTGWRHVYRLPIPSSLFTSPIQNTASSQAGPESSPITSDQITPITQGDWDVIDIVQANSTSGLVYFIASPDDAATRGLYVADASASQQPNALPTRVSPDLRGTFSYEISPSCEYAIQKWSDFNTPPVQQLVRLNPYEVIQTLEDNHDANEAIRDLAPIREEFVKLPISDDVTLDSWIMLPTTPEGSTPASCPLVIYAYGEPAGQTVTDDYSASGYLWHRLLVQNGIAVASIDNRGVAAPRGKAFRQAIYRKIGILQPVDQADGVNCLLQQFPQLDKDRVAAWGWSGGGSTSLHLLFRYPELFRAAISVAPVPDQLDYDTIYQERYQGLLNDETKVSVFGEGSPITHADNLEGTLLLVHGTGDDNVHYASVQRLINKLVALHKPFETMAYPNRSHSVSEGDGTAFHLRQKMLNFWKRNLIAAEPKPASTQPE